MTSRNEEANSFHYAVYQEVQRIPYGKVTTYGHIAKLIYRPLNARQVGQSLKLLPIEQAANESRQARSQSNDYDQDNQNEQDEQYEAQSLPEPEMPFHTGNVPWWRVINSQGKISPRGNHFAEDRQVEMLQGENVEVYEKSVNLMDYGWFPATEFDQ